MRSVNTAYKLGREIGRDVEDVWIPDELLLQRVRRSIGPRINLFRSDEEKARDNWSALFAFCAAFLVIAVAAVVIVFVPIEIPALASFLDSVRTWVATFPILLVIAVVVLLLIVTIASGFAWKQARIEATEVYDAAVAALHSAALQGATAVLEARRRKVGLPIEVSSHQVFPPPSPRPGGVDARGAEQVAAQWMRHLGEIDAELTSYTGDGGIDVQGRKTLAQVKHYATSVGVAAIRELAGVAANDPHRRQALFFTSTGYARGAVEFADSAGIALFVYDAERAGLQAMNPRAKTLMHNGIS
ncbi:hypothetical protein SRABI76_03542 [Microbacterium oxydans]|uniref:restriction endonuclease n=1 Tax=Microbacterium oxydans TaxID=82380 RepID=UPI001D5FE02D|nr:restriction endonuclease [Microbacterium oxydans]CAH0263261.1 hypothetical protein SRABI76_03542 [Microbacterium oxydans]